MCMYVVKHLCYIKHLQQYIQYVILEINMIELFKKNMDQVSIEKQEINSWENSSLPLL